MFSLRSDKKLLCLFFKGPGNSKPAKSIAVPPGPPVYLDLVYIPNHSNNKNVDVEFFKRVRSSYYVVSGNDPTAEEPSRAVLDSLLEGKAQWEGNMQVSCFIVFLLANSNPFEEQPYGPREATYLKICEECWLGGLFLK